MTEDLKKILASIFKIGKGDGLTKKEIENILSYSLRWFDPDGSRKVISAAVGSGLIQLNPDQMYIPIFDPEEVEMEVGYTPPKDIDLSNLTRPLIERLIEAVMTSGMKKREVVKEINRMGEEKGLLFPAAAIYVGISHGVDMSPFYNEAENFIMYGDR